MVLVMYTCMLDSVRLYYQGLHVAGEVLHNFSCPCKAPVTSGYSSQENAVKQNWQNGAQNNFQLLFLFIHLIDS